MRFSAMTPNKLMTVTIRIRFKTHSIEGERYDKIMFIIRKQVNTYTSLISTGNK